MHFTVESLRQEVESRTEKKPEINSRMDEICWNEFGISDFSQKVENLLPAGDLIHFCLSRQVPNINVEHLGMELLIRWLYKNGIPAVLSPLSFVEDVYSARNPYKASLVKVPIYKIARNGCPCCQNLSLVANFPGSGMEGMAISKISAKDGSSIPEFHSEWRRLVLGDSGIAADISNFFRQCLLECLENDGKIKPKFIFQRGEDGKEEKIALNRFRLNGNRGNVRPPADWYYLIYLMLFLDGSRALLSTVGDDAKVDSWFQESIRGIKDNVSLEPLIVDIPCEVEQGGFRSKLNEVPEAFLQGRRNLSEAPLPMGGDGSIFSAATSCYKEILSV